jgi:predicted small metal-binding protein
MNHQPNNPTKGTTMKTLQCRDAGFDCEGVIQAASEEEVLSQAAEHALSAHNVQVTPELAEQIKALIKDEES